MQVRDAMTRGVVSIECDAPVAEAIEIMLKSHISALPVLDADNLLVGILSEGDLLRRAELGTEKKRPRWLEFILGPGRFASAYVHAHGRKVSEAMTSDLVTIDENATLEEAVDLMNRHHIKRLPVLSGGSVVGIIARADVLRVLAPLLKPPARTASDEEIHDAILAELRREEWAPLAAIDVDVRNSLVSLRGTLTDERQRQALIVIAENTPGVRAIHDHMIWVEGNSGAYLMSEEDSKAEKASA